ncbi:hypothetical protein GCM10027347_62400 [Larkinella harenae]
MCIAVKSFIPFSKSDRRRESIRKADVVRAFLYIQRTYGLKGVKIRNDNGSQFVSHLVKDFLRNQQAKQDRDAGAFYARGDA